MKSALLRFYRRTLDFLEFCRQLKLIQCPHCQRTGYLILHGYLSGYNDKKPDHHIIRGRRIFCSNRNRRQGCGRTFSVLATRILRNFTITTSNLWTFLNNIATGINKFKAFKFTGVPFSASSVYRLYQRVYLRQQSIRTRLLKLSPLPANVLSPNPLVKTILHLKTAFATKTDPLAAFQQHFQADLL